MGKPQTRAVAPPTAADDKLQEFSSVVQANLRDLFQNAHSHDHATAPPGDRDGQVGDIRLVTSGGSFKLYVKFAAGWKSATFS